MLGTYIYSQLVWTLDQQTDVISHQSLDGLLFNFALDHLHMCLFLSFLSFPLSLFSASQLNCLNVSIIEFIYIPGSEARQPPDTCQRITTVISLHSLGSVNVQHFMAIHHVGVGMFQSGQEHRLTRLICFDSGVCWRHPQAIPTIAKDLKRIKFSVPFPSFFGCVTCLRLSAFVSYCVLLSSRTRSWTPLPGA